MNRETAIRVTLGVLIVLGGGSIVVATLTEQDAYVSLGGAVVSLASAVAIVYSRRGESAD